ncbi:hypothetical protein ACWGIU_10000 [Streptomyces sp. NPDC054840]
MALAAKDVALATAHAPLPGLGAARAASRAARNSRPGTSARSGRLIGKT